MTLIFVARPDLVQRITRWSDQFYISALDEPPGIGHI